MDREVIFALSGVVFHPVDEHTLELGYLDDYPMDRVQTTGWSTVEMVRKSAGSRGRPTRVVLLGEIGHTGTEPVVSADLTGRVKSWGLGRSREEPAVTVQTVGEFHWVAEIVGPAPYTVRVGDDWEQMVVL